MQIKFESDFSYSSYNLADFQMDSFQLEYSKDLDDKNPVVSGVVTTADFSAFEDSVVLVNPITHLFEELRQLPPRAGWWEANTTRISSYGGARNAVISWTFDFDDPSRASTRILLTNDTMQQLLFEDWQPDPAYVNNSLIRSIDTISGTFGDGTSELRNGDTKAQFYGNPDVPAEGFRVKFEFNRQPGSPPDDDTRFYLRGGSTSFVRDDRRYISSHGHGFDSVYVVITLENDDIDDDSIDNLVYQVDLSDGSNQASCICAMPDQLEGTSRALLFFDQSLRVLNIFATVTNSVTIYPFTGYYVERMWFSPNGKLYFLGLPQANSEVPAANYTTLNLYGMDWTPTATLTPVLLDTVETYKGCNRSVVKLAGTKNYVLLEGCSMDKIFDMDNEVMIDSDRVIQNLAPYYGNDYIMTGVHRWGESDPYASVVIKLSPTSRYDFLNTNSLHGRIRLI